MFWCILEHVFEVQMPARNGLKMNYFQFIGTTCYNLMTPGTLGVL